MSSMLLPGIDYDKDSQIYICNWMDLGKVKQSIRQFHGSTAKDEAILEVINTCRRNVEFGESVKATTVEKTYNRHRDNTKKMDPKKQESKKGESKKIDRKRIDTKKGDTNEKATDTDTRDAIPWYSNLTRDEYYGKDQYATFNGLKDVPKPVISKPAVVRVGTHINRPNGFYNPQYGPYSVPSLDVKWASKNGY